MFYLSFKGYFSTKPVKSIIYISINLDVLNETCTDSICSYKQQQYQVLLQR